MKEFKTINDIHMIQCGEYNWIILKEYDGTDIYQLVISKSEEQHRRGHDDITLYYDKKNEIFSVRSFNTTYNGGDYFCFKMKFEDTPLLVKSLIDGEGGHLGPIYHSSTVKIKQHEYRTSNKQT